METEIVEEIVTVAGDKKAVVIGLVLLAAGVTATVVVSKKLIAMRSKKHAEVEELCEDDSE